MGAIQKNVKLAAMTDCTQAATKIKEITVSQDYWKPILNILG